MKLQPEGFSKKVCATGIYFLRQSNCSSASKETCFPLYLRKGKLFLKLFWLLSSPVVAKFCKIFVIMKKKQNNNNNKKHSEKSPTKNNFSLKIGYFLAKKVTCNIVKN